MTEYLKRGCKDYSKKTYKEKYHDLLHDVLLQHKLLNNLLLNNDVIRAYMHVDIYLKEVSAEAVAVFGSRSIK